MSNLSRSQRGPRDSKPAALRQLCNDRAPAVGGHPEAARSAYLAEAVPASEAQDLYQEINNGELSGQHGTMGLCLRLAAKAGPDDLMGVIGLGVQAAFTKWNVTSPLPYLTTLLITLAVIVLRHRNHGTTGEQGAQDQA
jgi:hypothetical protein